MNTPPMSGWGRLRTEPPSQVLAHDWRFEPLPPATAPMLAIGRRRSYGDSCVNERGTLLCTRRLDRLIAFDSVTGLLDCEPGVTLGEILRAALPRGWYLPVVPGTQHVSVGGAVANDVHGKNHVRMGSFGCHVQEITLRRSDRGDVLCSPTVEPELFAATIGGLGLTGLLISVRIALKPVPGARMCVDERPFGSLEEYSALLLQNRDREYSVAWVDASRLNRGCRGLLSFADHVPGGSTAPRASIDVPITPLVSLINSASAWCLSRTYAAFRARHARTHEIDHAPYFFPLDGLGGWNRLYGRHGFRQYQCVVPEPAAAQGCAEILRAVQSSGRISPLIVLKDFGPRRSPGLLSFPREGLTLAMDFPEHQALPGLFDRLDAIVREHDGALYPAKDSRMSTTMFRASFPQFERFCVQLDPAFSSSFWERVR